MSERILVVDDEKIILELTSMILRSKGYEVFTAESGKEGIEQVQRESPAVVLLDYMMPAMDGMTALRRIRAEFPDSYVIMFTGKGSEEIAVELMKAGASDYILKPFNNQDLIDRIENVLRIRRIEMNNKELREETGAAAAGDRRVEPGTRTPGGGKEPGAGKGPCRDHAGRKTGHPRPSLGRNGPRDPQSPQFDQSVHPDT